MVLQRHHVAIVALDVATTYLELAKPFLVRESVSHGSLIDHFSYDLWVSAILTICVCDSSRKS